MASTSIRTSSSDVKLSYSLSGSGDFSPELQRLTDRLRQLEEDLDSERELRSRIERERQDLSIQLIDVSERLDDAEGGSSAQMELNRKREQETQKMRKMLEEAHLESEESIAANRLKHQAAINDLNEQLEHLQKAKAKSDKEKSRINGEMLEMSAQLDHVLKEKEASDKHARDMEKELIAANGRMDDLGKQLHESNQAKSKLQAENMDLSDRVRDAQKQNEQLQHLKIEIQKQLEDTKRHLDEEIKIKITIQAQLKNCEAELHDARGQLEESLDRQAELERQVAKARAEADSWKAKYDAEVQARAESEEEWRRRLQQKAQEFQEQLEILMAKCSNLEKAKSKLQQELSITISDLEKAHTTIHQLEGRCAGLEKIVIELKAQNDALAAECDAARKDAAAAKAELAKAKQEIAALIEKNTALDRENKKLAHELHDAKDRLNTATRTIHELEVTIKRLEADNAGLAEAYKDAERRARDAEARAKALADELARTRAEWEKKLQQKQEEMEAMRKGMQIEIDILVQRVNDAEAKLKSEVARLKKKFMAEIHELEMSLDHANHLNMELQKTNKKLASDLKDVQALYEDCQRQLAQALDQVSALQRKVSSLAGELEEAKAALDQALRARKAAEREAEEKAAQVNHLTTINVSLTSQVKKLEQDVHIYRSQLDEAVTEARLANDRAQKAAADAAKAIDDLHGEQEKCAKLSSAKQSLEAQVKDLHIRIQEVEANAMATAKRMVVKLEVRIRELEVEVDEEKKKHAMTLKSLRGRDRAINDLKLQLEEESTKVSMYQETTEKLTHKCSHYKRIVDETEGMSVGALARMRRVERELEDAEGRADMAESNLNLLRAKHHSCVTTSRINPSVKVTVEERRIRH